MTALRFSHVTHRYGKKIALADMNLSVAAGQIVCLLGSSGCGKTTSLKLAAGTEMPSAGEIFIDETCVSGKGVLVPPEARNIGFLFQDYALFPHLTAKENVLFGLTNRGWQDKAKRAMELLTKTGIAALANQYPAALSGGEQQRLALARALAPAPDLMLMDEPFSVLDPQLRDAMRRLTLAMLREAGATSLIVTHDPTDALYMADKVAVQRAGRIIQFDSPAAIYNKPMDALVGRLFGRANSIRAKRENNMIALPIGQIPSKGADARVELMVRPHDIMPDDERARENEGEICTFSATITHCRQIGADWLLDIVLADGTSWEVQTRHKPALKTGETGQFHINQRDLRLFDI